ncbi:MAG: aldehyde dehydrogenase family protein, partial [Actinomycetia bacterium]|nr:aldehyde dehydrogenase family protein [Actinomycetes bacterium]
MVEARSGEAMATINPATEEHLSNVAVGGPDDIDAAVAAARRAQSEVWGPMPGRERAKYLYRIARLLQERSREFAVLETLDGGKPIKESRDVDLPTAAAHFFYYAGWADKLDFAFPGRRTKPIGVAGQVIPWNFPILMAAWKLAPALATGNTIVLKPAETTPLSALLLADLLNDAEVPPGVVNIVTGGRDTGAALVAHPGIDKVAFTGSSAVGKQIQAAIAGTTKRLSLELGGKAANIVFADAALDQAVEGVVNGIFFNQGHVCCAGSRLLVQEPIAEDFVERLKNRLSTLRLGDPLDKNTDVGAINSAAQLAKITELVQSGVDDGATLYQPPCDLPDSGFWFAPTLLSEVTQAHRVVQEEIFGPVLSVARVGSLEEAFELGTLCEYGNGAVIFTRDG